MESDEMALVAEELGVLLNELIDKVSSEAIDELGLRRYESRARQLMDSWPAMAHLILAITCSCRLNHPEAIKHSEIACSLERNVLNLSNFALILKKSGDISRAINLLIEAEALEPADLSIKQDILMYLSASFRYFELHRKLTQYKKLNQIDQLNIEGIDFADANRVFEILRSNGVSETGLDILSDCVWSTLPILSTDSISQWFHDDHIYLEYRFDKSVDELVDINMELVEALADLDLSPEVLSTVSVSVLAAG